MGRIITRGEAQRQFIKRFDGLCLSHSRWQVWQDMVWMMAAAISNAVDTAHRDQREKQCMEAIGRYSAQEVQVFPELFALLVAAFEADPFQDFLGDLFMRLELYNHWHGQFFTPLCVCRMMADINRGAMAQGVAEKGWISVCDPACGAGATLIAAAQTMYEAEVNYQQHALFVGQDIDSTAGLMCYIQLSLLGCAGYVKIGNTLTEPTTGDVLYGEQSDAMWYTPMFYHAAWHWRRAWHMADRLIGRMPPAPVGESESETAPAIIEISGQKRGRRRTPGQLMFDVG